MPNRNFALPSSRIDSSFRAGRRAVLTFGLALISTSGQSWAQSAPAPPAVDVTDAEAISQRIQSVYDAAKTYSAQFKQRYYIAAYDKYKDSRGHVTFAKPGRMRWEYTNNKNVVVSDGKQIKVYEEENKQMYVQAVDKAQYPAALSFLTGEGNLSQEFHLQVLDANKLKFPGGIVLLGTPKSPTPAYQKILFYVDKQTFQVRRVLLMDAQKNRNRFDFEQASINKAVPAAAFAYTPPPGTRIVKP